jgi:hypothetical protein
MDFPGRFGGGRFLVPSQSKEMLSSLGIIFESIGTMVERRFVSVSRVCSCLVDDRVVRRVANQEPSGWQR